MEQSARMARRGWDVRSRSELLLPPALLLLILTPRLLRAFLCTRYHFSRATSVEDVPEWLFTPQELAARRRAGPTRRRSSVQDFNPNLPGGSIRTRRLSERKQSLVDFNPNAAPVVDSPAKEERERRRRGEEQSTIAEEPSGGYGGYGGSGSRATDKLRAMREAKRVMH